jgi:hypothetical protein
MRLCLLSVPSFCEKRTANCKKCNENEKWIWKWYSSGFFGSTFAASGQWMSLKKKQKPLLHSLLISFMLDSRLFLTPPLFCSWPTHFKCKKEGGRGMKEGYRIFRPLCVLLVPLAHLSSPVNLQFSWANGKNRNIIISESSLFSACVQKWDFTDAFVFCLLWVSRCAFFYFVSFVHL